MTQKHKITARPERSALNLPPRAYKTGERVEIELNREPEGRSGADLGADLYQAYYQPEVSFKSDDQIQGRQVNKRLLEWMAEKPSFENVRARTVGSVPTSAMMTGLMYDSISSDEALQAALKKQEEVEKKREEAEQTGNQAQALQNLLDHMKQNGEGEEDPETEERLQNLQDRIESLQRRSEEAQGQAEQMGQDLEETLDDLGNNPIVQANISNMQRETAQEAKETANVLNQWGMGPGSPEARDPQSVQDVQRLLSPKIKEIARIAGRMRSISLTSKRGSTESGILPTEVEYTQNLSSTFVGEFAPLREEAPEIIRSEKALQWATRGLQGFDKTSTGKERGAFFALADDSGSMGGIPEIVAKGMSLGIAQAAQAEEDRPYGLASFSYHESDIREVTSEDSWRDHWEWAETHVGGGTDIGTAIRYGIRRVRDLSLEGHHPDFLLLSDGHGRISEEAVREWKRFAEETGARLFYVPIGMSPQTEIREISTEVIPLDSIDEEGATKVAKTVGKYL